ncbi:MAG TPA: hypothetical protein VG452_05065 [Egibacteraceae bacterium]|nr:hypothetical protein [Actinomycetota bacterium]HWB71570.1 hypothetical protein [Egibacteraceae bacterium]
MSDDTVGDDGDPRGEPVPYGPRPEADDATQSDAGLTAASVASVVPGTAWVPEDPTDSEDAGAERPTDDEPDPPDAQRPT